jgi:hypothetical protein
MNQFPRVNRRHYSGKKIFHRPTGSRFQVVWAIVIAGQIVARYSLGEGSRSICVARSSGMVTMLFVPVAISGKSWR